MNKMKSIRYKIISVLLTAFCLLGNVIPVLAAEETPRIHFENTRDSGAHLYVNKTVKSADDRYPVPEDAVFSFVLMIDGSLAEYWAYRVFNADGQEVFLYSAGESTEDTSNKIAYTTDRSGNFTLKAGQTAKFEYVGAGKSYKVTEMALSSFEQTVPAGGEAAVGTILLDGSVASFTNVYIPEGSESKTTNIVITKDTSFPSNYQLPESPDFTFVIRLKGKAYALEEYSIMDTLTGMRIGTGTTDAAGRFTLQIGQAATFQDAPADVDYQIVEQVAKGWRVVGETNREGATIAPVTTINYTNVNASFGVTKTLSDHSTPDVEFTFQLTDYLQAALAGVQYYLYNPDGLLADTTIHETDAQGHFVLKPGQTAIFIGIDPGTVYNVSEQGNTNYNQIIPGGGVGYTNKVVTNMVEILPFVNEEVPDSRALTVTKLVQSESGEVPMNEDIFTFQLTRLTDGTYEPVAGAVYSITVGTSISTYSTDAEGKFRIKRNEKARFEGLSADLTYRVEEVEIPIEFRIETKVQEGILTDQLNFTFENIYKTKEIDLHLHKKNDQGEILPNARFNLYADETLVNKINAEPLLSDENGKIVIPSMKAGIYYLVETASPDGYQMLANPIKIELYWDSEWLHVLVDGTEYNSTDPEDQIYLVRSTDGNDEAHITVINSKNFGIPLAGGAGTMILVLVVLSGVGVISFTFIRKSRRTM